MKVLKTTSIWMLTFCLAFTFSSCLEDDISKITNPTSSSSPAAPNPSVGPGAGAFWGINALTTVTTPTTFDTKIGTAVAVFSNDNFNSFIDAGKVSVMDKDLDQNDNKSYTYIPGISQPLGLEFVNNYQWTVAGSGSVPGFTHAVDFAFPTLGGITSPEVVEKSAGYTLSCENVAQADSIIYMVGEVLKTVGGNVTSVTFSSDDLKSVSKGTSFVQIAAYRYKPETINGKTYYFGNETVRSQVVEIE